VLSIVAIRACPAALFGCLEVPRVRRRLVLARRRQVAVSRQEVVLLANYDVVVALAKIAELLAGTDGGQACVPL
jgi:hypothetical protein